jgi:hypothetical protein
MRLGLRVAAIASAIALGCGALVCGDGDRPGMRSVNAPRSEMAERGNMAGEA